MLVAMPALAGAQSLNMAQFASAANSGLSIYLSNYIPNATISGSTFFGNQTLSGSNYIIMQLPGKNNYIIIANKNSSYMIITNTTTINGVLTPFLSTKYYPNAATLSYLNSTLRAYMAPTSQPLNDCATTTGITQGQCNVTTPLITCIQNTCAKIPICGGVLKYPTTSMIQKFGVPSPFANGVRNFSINYTKLNNSYKSYFSVLATLNKSNSAAAISQLSSLAANISIASTAITQNPIMPSPPGFTGASCYSGASTASQPWQCVATGYCAAIPFNATKLSSIQSNISSIQANLPSVASLASISANSSITAQQYMALAAQNKNGAAFTALMNTYSPQYNSIVVKTNALLLRYNNITLNSSVQVLKTEFRAIQTLGVNQSIAVANTILGSLIANSTKIYTNASASYAQVYGISQNNSAAIIADQLSYQQVPSKLAALADNQQMINMKLNSIISSNELAGLVTSAQSIRVQAAVFVAPLTIGYMIKILDTPFISSLLGGSGSSASAPQLIATAPLYAALASLIVGILVIIIIFIITHLRIIKKGKLKGDKNKQRTWGAVFVILIILVIIYTYATYAYALNANSFLPFNYYMNTLKASGNAYIALNGSAGSNASIISCANTMQGYLADAGKSVQIIRLTNYSCVSGSNISVLGLNCYNNILGSGKPVILISQSRQNQIVYKGLYGTVLYASGNVTRGSACLLSTLFKK